MAGNFFLIITKLVKFPDFLNFCKDSLTFSGFPGIPWPVTNLLMKFHVFDETIDYKLPLTSCGWELDWHEGSCDPLVNHVRNTCQKEKKIQHGRAETVKLLIKHPQKRINLSKISTKNKYLYVLVCNFDNLIKINKR